MPNESFWTVVRDQFLLPRETAFLNAANLCPSPMSVVEVVTNARDLDHDVSPPNRVRLRQAREHVRGAVADFLGVRPEEIVITRNASESNNLVSSGLDLDAGDEVLAFADNHPSNLDAWREKARRFGWVVRVIAQPCPHPGPEYYIEAFRRACTARTRILAFSHLTHTVGDVLPAAELCRIARECGILTLVDGAQSFGLMEVNLSRMEPDFYSGSAHKWLCGPKEVGVLFVRGDAQARLAPAVISGHAGGVGAAIRLEGLGQRDDCAIVGFAEAVRFQASLGRGVIEGRAQELASAVRDGLRSVRGVRMWTSNELGRCHAIVTFAVPGRDPHRLQEILFERHRVVCAVSTGPYRPGLRLSPHFFNTAEDVERALAGIHELTNGRS